MWLVLFLTGCIYSGMDTDTDALWMDTGASESPRSDRGDQGDPDGTPDCVDCCWDYALEGWAECGNGGSDQDTDVSNVDTGAAVGPVALQLSPNTLAPGATDIVRLSSSEPGLSGVVGLTFVGDVQLLTWALHDDQEITLVLEAGSTPGTVDLIVDYGDGSAVFINDGLSVAP